MGEAKDGNEILPLCGELHPDLLLMDLRMPHLVPVEMIRQVRSQFPEIKILILSAFSAEGYLRDLFKLGVAGFVLKDEIPETLVRAIQAVVEGNTWFSAELMQKMAIVETDRDGREMDLTERELTVIALASEGKTNRQIACELNVSKRTVDYYVGTLLDKFGAQNRAQLVLLATEKGVYPVKSIP